MRVRCRGRSRRRFAAALLVVAVSLLLGANPSPPENWSLSYETNPANSDNVSQGASWFRQLKLDVRERLEVEGHFGSVNADDNGLMRVGSARCFVGTSAPTDIEQVDHDNTGGAGTSTLSDDATNSLPAEKVGHARCWLDTDGADNTAGTIDDDTLWVYDSTNGWEEVTRLNDAAIEYSTFSNNLLWNGSFEVGAGTSAPDGWSTVNVPTLAYSSTDTSEGSGQELHVTASGGANGGIQRTLAGLKASTQYIGVIRANALAGDTCSLRTTAGSSNITETTASSGAYETLVGAFTVAPGGATVTFIAEADANGDVCRFDHAGVYEIGSTTVHPAVPSSSSWAEAYALTGGRVGDTGGGETIIQALSQTYIVESPGCYFDVSAVVRVAAVAGSGDNFEITLQRSVNGGGFTTVSVALSAASTATFDVGTYSLEYLDTGLTPGDTYAYRVNTNDSGVNAGIYIDVAASNDLNIRMVCTGS